MAADEIELRDYVRGLWKEKWLILLVLVVTIGIAVAISWGLPRQYVTETTLLAPRVSEQLTAEGEPLGRTFSAETYKSMALANDLLEEIIEALDLRVNPAQPDSNLLAAESLERHMRVEVVGAETAGQRSPEGSRFPLLTMRVQGTDPKRISQIGNMWAKLFIQRNTHLLETATAQSYEFIAERFTELNTELTTKEEEQKQYKTENPLELWESNVEILRDRYENFLGQLQDKRLALIENQAQLARLEPALAEEPPYLEPKRSISTESLWELLSRNPNPQELAALANLSLTEQQINQVYLSLKDQLIQTQVTVDTLKEGIQYLEGQVQELEGQITQKGAKIGEVQLTLEQMDREIEVLRQTFSSLFNRFQEARIAKAESESSIRVVESAIPPRVPIAPRKLLNVGVAGVLGLFLGMILASFRWYMITSPDRGGEEEKRKPNGQT